MRLLDSSVDVQVSNGAEESSIFSVSLQCRVCDAARFGAFNTVTFDIALPMNEVRRWHLLSISCWEIECFCCFKAPSVERSPSTDAFHEMHRSQRAQQGFIEEQHDADGTVLLFAPECTVSTIKNGKDQLTVDIWDTFRSAGLGWLAIEQAKTFGVPFLKALSELHWEITDQWAVLSSKGCKPRYEWECYEGRRKNTHRKARDVDLSALETKVACLEGELQQTWWDAAPTWSATWRDMCMSVDDLCSRLCKFLDRRI